MAAAKKEKIEIPEGYVEISVPRAGIHDEQNVYVSVNDECYLIPTGKTSAVPKHIADEYYRSIEAQNAFWDRVSEASNSN